MTTDNPHMDHILANMDSDEVPYKTGRTTSAATVILFKPSGKYYSEEKWAVPADAIGPYDMKRSPDFRRIDGGAVLVDTQEPWGYPHLFPGATTR